MQRRYILLAFILILLCLGLGYALISTDLNITGTTVLKDNRWDIHFENVTTLQTAFGASRCSGEVNHSCNDGILYASTWFYDDVVSSGVSIGFGLELEDEGPNGVVFYGWHD